MSTVVDIEGLTRLDGVVDVIEDDQSIFVIMEGSEQPVIFSDREVVFVDRSKLLQSEHLMRLAAGRRAGKQAPSRHLMHLYEYDVSHLRAVDKQRLSHRLSGTGGRRGLLEELGGRRVGRGAVMVPFATSSEMAEFMESLDAKYTKTPILLEETGWT